MASPSTASWTDPLKNTDGSAIAAGEITGYTVGVRDTTAAGSVAGTYPFSATAPATATSEPLALLTPVLPTGKLLAGAVKANTGGTSSVWSAEATFTLASTPLQPTAFTIA